MTTPDDDLLYDLLDRWEEAYDHGTPLDPAGLCRDRPHLVPELARRIRRRYSSDQVRVIGISSSTDRTTSAGFLKAGAHDFIARPFVLEELQCRIAANAETLLRISQLHDLAWRDFLTGLFNRRHFFERGPRLIAETRRAGQPACVAILDIDHFKRINDGHGHEGGDDALRGLADYLNRALEGRAHLLARLGGEEFALILPGVAEAQAAAFAETLRAGLARRRMPIRDEAVGLTVSIGVAEVTADEPLDQALNRADRALYAAKQGGRNRIQA